MSERAELRPGLREVIAGQTQICGWTSRSRVYIYGYSLEELVEHHSYEETAYLTLTVSCPRAKTSSRPRRGACCAASGTH